MFFLLKKHLNFKDPSDENCVLILWYCSDDGGHKQRQLSLKLYFCVYACAETVLENGIFFG